MNPTLRTVLPVAAIGLGALALLTLAALPQDPGAAQVDPAALAGTLSYQVAWTTHTTTHLPGAPEPLHASLDVQGALAVTHAGDVSLWQLRDLTTATLSLDGHALPLDRVALVDRVVRADAHGVTVLGTTDDTTRHVLEALVQTALVEPTDGTRTTPYGTAAHTWDGDTRTTSHYVTLRADPQGTATTTGSGEALRTRRPDGHVAALQSTEVWTSTAQGVPVFAVEDHLSLTPATRVQRPVRAPLLAQTTPAPTQDGLHAQARDLSGIALVTQLGNWQGAPPPETAALMWRGTARIALEPDVARQVSQIARQADATDAQRELALDLLAHAPAVHAQEALLEALQDDTLRAHDAYPMWLQRLSFVRAPTAGTAAWIADQRADADPRVARAATHTAGALSRRAAEAGDDALADALAEPLVEASTQGDPEDRAAALSGLGNAARSQDVGVVLAACEGPEVVHRSALLALRAWEAPEVDTAMLAGVRHPSVVVQRAALTALEGRSLPEASVQGWDQQVVPTLDPSNLGLLVTVLAPHAASDSARQALGSVLRHEHASPRLRARVRTLLAL